MYIFYSYRESAYGVSELSGFVSISVRIIHFHKGYNKKQSHSKLIKTTM